MHDFSLGGPVDMGEYCGPLLKGQPLHPGSCEDGVYGCRRCGNVISGLSTEELKEIGAEDRFSCDWCKKEFPLKERNGIRPWDEPSCYYEVCDGCKRKHDDDLRKEFAPDPVRVSEWDESYEDYWEHA